MILSPSQTERYYKLYDLLSTYAHRQLGVVGDDEFFDQSGPRGINLRAQNETMRELWFNRGIISKYVNRNPDGLARNDLDVLDSWTSAYDAMFYVMRKPDSLHEVYYLSQDHAFEVCGIVKEPDEAVPVMPTMADATLLPFEERIVPALLFMAKEEPLTTDESQRGEEMLSRALSNDNVISTGYQLRKCEAQLTMSRADEAIDRLKDLLATDSEAFGLSEQERDKMLETMTANGESVQGLVNNIMHFDERVEALSFELIDRLCTPGPVVTSLEAMVNAYEHADADAKGDTSDMAHSHYKEALIEHARNLEWIQEEVGRMPCVDFDFFERLVKADGRLHVGMPEVLQMRDIPFPHKGLMYYFNEDDGFAAIVPDEVLPVARKLDWEKARSDVRRHMMLVRFFDAVLELRGIVDYYQAVDEYLALFPADGRDASDIILELEYAIDDGESRACVLQTPEADYLIHREMLSEWRIETYGKRAKRGTTHEKGEVGKLVGTYLKRHAERDPRPIQLEMLEGDHLDDWKCKLPTVLALWDFLELQAPEDEDLATPAQEVLGELLAEAAWGTPKESTESFFTILEYYGYFFDDDRAERTALELWLRFFNSLPNWRNNGWSPNEVERRRPGKRAFFNPDGSVMKVGRNDSCPCGSGKKYKRCCGR